MYSAQRIHEQLDALRTTYDFICQENVKLKTEKDNLLKKCNFQKLS